MWNHLNKTFAETLTKPQILFVARTTMAGEVVDKSWLCFSPSQTCVKCFTYRLMCADTAKCAHFLIRKGIFDWKHALEHRRSHKHSMEDIDATITFSRRCNWSLWSNRTSQYGQSMCNNIGSRLCLQRLVSVPKFVAERGLAFRDGENVRSPRNFFQKVFKTVFKQIFKKVGCF